MKWFPDRLWWQRLDVRIGLLVFGVAILLYGKTASYGYAWDDAIVIQENDRVHAGFSGLTSHWIRFRSARLQDQYGYRPVTMTTFGIEYGLFGAKPGVSHAINTLLYGLLCVLVFATLRRLLPGLNFWVVTAAALLYAAHPLHVEAVANIKSRDEILGFLFALGSLWLLLRYYDTGRWWQLIGAMASFALAYLSRESAVMILPVMGLAILMQPGTWRKKLTILVPLPLLVLSAYVVFQLASSNTAGVETTAGMGMLQEDLGLGNPMLRAPNTDLFLPTQSALPLRYLGKFFWPWPLQYYSGFNHIPLSDWSRPIVGLSLSAIGWWLVLSLVFVRRDKTLLLGFTIFASYLFIYCHFYRPLADLMADRFMLAPSLGVCLLAAWVPSLLLGVRHAPAAAGADVAPPRGYNVRLGIYLGILAAFTLLMGYRTLDRIPAWRDNLSLFSTDIPHLQDCARCHVHYAGALAQEYTRKGGSEADAARIKAEYARGIAICPSVYYGRIELAQFHYARKDFAAGVAAMEDAVKEFPDQGRPYYYMGYGEYYLGQYGIAAEHLKRSWDKTPDREDAPYLLAWAYFFGGKVDEAVALAQACTVRFPHNDQFHDAWSDFLFGSERADDGFKVLQAAVARFHSQLLYRKIVQRYTESGNPEAAQNYRAAASQHGISL